MSNKLEIEKVTYIEFMEDLKLSDAEYITLTDASGIVILRANIDKKGDDISQQHVVSQAIRGKDAVDIERGTVTKLAIKDIVTVSTDTCNVVGLVVENIPSEIEFAIGYNRTMEKVAACIANSNQQQTVDDEERTMTIQELINRLTALAMPWNSDVFIEIDDTRHQISNFASYRGIYSELAIAYGECNLLNIGGLINRLRDIVERKEEFRGWKGGEYTYGMTTPIWAVMHESDSSGYRITSASVQPSDTRGTCVVIHTVEA